MDIQLVEMLEQGKYVKTEATSLMRNSVQIVIRNIWTTWAVMVEAVFAAALLLDFEKAAITGPDSNTLVAQAKIWSVRGGICRENTCYALSPKGSSRRLKRASHKMGLKLGGTLPWEMVTECLKVTGRTRAADPYVDTDADP